MRGTVLLTTLLCLLTYIVDPPIVRSAQVDEDKELLKKRGLGVDSKSLLEYLRKRTHPEADPTKVDVLIKRLGHELFQLREDAQAALLELGPTALVALKQAEKSEDTEIRRRAEEIRTRIEANAQPVVQAATIRLIGEIKPNGGAEVLLAFAPFAADQKIEDELAEALGNIAKKNEKVAKKLVEMLSDRLAAKRGVAVDALLRAGVKSESAQALLKDKDAGVRLRVAIKMVRQKDASKEVVPVLISCLSELPPERLWPAEEILTRLAGDKAPAAALGSTKATQEQCRNEWEKWWEANKETIKLAKLQGPAQPLGFTLVMHQIQASRVVNGRRIYAQARVVELNSEWKTRWQFDLDSYPVDGEVVGGSRVLIAEYQKNRITERDFKGNILWQLQVNNPIAVQRLSNGNTMVANRYQIEEYDRQANRLFSWRSQVSSLHGARKLPNGEIVFVTSSGRLNTLNPKTKAVKANNNYVGRPAYYGGISLTPKGNVMVPDYSRNRILVIDLKNRKQLKSLNFSRPAAATSTKDGGILAASASSGRSNVVEYDEKWQNPQTRYRTNYGMIFCIKPR